MRSEKLGEVAGEFDRIHSVERALRVGSLDRILPPAQLRPYLIEAVERGLARAGEAARVLARPPGPFVLLLSAEEVPEDSAWLGPAEQEQLARLRVPKRRRDFLVGRLAAKRALALHEGEHEEEALRRFEVRPTEGGAPRAFRDGLPYPVALSLSHSDGWAAALVNPEPGPVGCDLERVETRSASFLGDYFTRDEQSFVSAGGAPERALRATLVWSAKESVMKALGEGLRLPPTSVEVSPSMGSESDGGWRRFAVSAPPLASRLRGFWRRAGGFLLTLAGDIEEPRLLGGSSRPDDSGAR